MRTLAGEGDSSVICPGSKGCPSEIGVERGAKYAGVIVPKSLTGDIYDGPGEGDYDGKPVQIVCVADIETDDATYGCPKGYDGRLWLGAAYWKQEVCYPGKPVGSPGKVNCETVSTAWPGATGFFCKEGGSQKCPNMPELVPPGP